MATMNSRHSRDPSPAARGSMATQAPDAAENASTPPLDELGARYRYPVYAYVRCCGHTPAIAQDIANSFLRDLRSRLREREMPAGSRHFRRFLIDQLHQWLADDWHRLLKEVDDDPIAEDATLEARHARDQRPADPPDRAFQRAFALEVLHRALARLRAEALQTGHLDMYVALVPLLGRDPAPGECDGIACALQVHPQIAVVALGRLRGRLRELAREELADTVVGSGDLAAEQQALLAILQSPD